MKMKMMNSSNSARFARVGAKTVPLSSLLPFYYVFNADGKLFMNTHHLFFISPFLCCSFVFFWGGLFEDSTSDQKSRELLLYKWPLEIKSSSQKRKTKVIRINKKQHRNGINISTREDRSVRRLSDATIDRTRRMGRELGAFLVCDFFFSRARAR
jgi:hypothetical protein